MHTDTSFRFVGSNRDLVLTDSVQKCIEVTDVIFSTGLPNYRMTFIPIKSGLHLQAWRNHLVDYPDQRLIQYLTFGFPLSVMRGGTLSL